MTLSTGSHEPALQFIDTVMAELAGNVDGIDLDAARLVLLLHRVTNVVVYDLESSVHRPSGWSWAAFRTMFALWIAGPLESRRVAELTGMSRQAVSALTNTLERDGVIERRDAADDGRSVILALTRDGRRRLAAAYRAHNRRESQWAGALSAPERATLISLLAKLAAAAESDWVSHRF